MFTYIRFFIDFFFFLALCLFVFCVCMYVSLCGLFLKILVSFFGGNATYSSYKIKLETSILHSWCTVVASVQSLEVRFFECKTSALLNLFLLWIKVLNQCA